ncbi:MAG: hypothetical protein K0B07_05785 [DPANN group archaeon]|nr:hypothetical protein [DPANN group archaeon]
MKSTVLIIFIFLDSAFGAVLTADMIDPSGALSSMGLLAAMVLSVILVLIGIRKTLNGMGK